MTPLVMLLYFVAIFHVALLARIVSSRKCSWSKAFKDGPDVYWINMDKSVDRKQNTEIHMNELGYTHQRVRGITPKQILIPDDILRTWQTAACKLDSDSEPPPRWELNSTSQYFEYTAFAAALCGRGKKKNTPKELGCTSSHLIAMRKAIYNTKAKSNYALIIEDDVHFPFDVDFEALAATAPKDFGILQLFNSNQGSMKSTWNMYLKDHNNLWVKRHSMKFFDFWSTCAYLINRSVMKKVIDNVAYEKNGWLYLKIIAGINNPCVPRGCCAEGTDNFVLSPPCVWAPRGYQADSYLYATTTTYMLTIPLISNGLGGNQSTFHQDHVESVHRNAFIQQRQFINEMLTGSVPTPPFVRPACDGINAMEI